ncbi:MAG: hypothetical protein R3B72_43965 [Polyangiaceae bacterium]
MVGLLSFSDEGAATGIRRSLIEPLGEGCTPWGDRPWPSARRLRLSLAYSDLVQAPGGPANVTQSPMTAVDVEHILLTREGCTAPELVTLVPESASCKEVTVAVADRPLPPGRYTVQTPSGSLVVEVVGGAPGPCPDEAESRARLDELRRRDEERERERLRQLQLQEQEHRRERAARLEALRRACIPPRQFNPLDESCRVPAPSPRPGPAPSPPRDVGFWDDPEWQDHRGDWGFIASAGAAAQVAVTELATGPDRDRGFVGGSLSVGFRHFRPFARRGLLELALESEDTTVEGMVWCAPVLCGVLGLPFMPLQAAVGNDHGLDLRAAIGRDFRAGPDGAALSLSLHPVLQVSRGSRFSTTSTAGTLLPEVGIQLATGADRAMFLRWHLMAFDLRLGRHLALAWDGAGPSIFVPFDGSAAWLSLGTGLRIQALAISE